VATPAFGSYCERVEYSLTCESFASFHAPYNLVRLMCEQFLILRLAALCGVFYG